MASDDWQAGDLALCVTTEYQDRPGNDPWVPKSGGVYQVSGVDRYPTGLFLEFADDPDAFNPELGWEAKDFRKIHPHAPDAEDRETIDLLNGIKEVV